MQRLSRRVLHLFALATVAGGAANAQAPTWTQRQAPMPLSLCGGEVAYDAARAETMLVTGTGCNQVWTWNGVTWTQRTTPAGAPMVAVRLCYDSGRQRLVAVFGNQSTGLQTWEWNGTQWSLGATGGLPARQGFGLAYDAARAVTVLFGGYDGSSHGYTDTWTWNGQTWTQVGNGGPTPRWNTTMVFDDQSQSVVLFGGEGHNSSSSFVSGDTWEWNGSQWIAHFGLPGPPARRNHGMAYDSDRRRVVLFGGGTLQNSLTDTWEWNGSAWAQLAPVGNPGTGTSGLAYDLARGVMVTWRGVQNPSTTWEYVAGPGVPATFAVYGAGCLGPNGVPALTPVGGSVPRIGSTLQLQVDNLSASPLAIPFGLIGLNAADWNGVPLPADLTPVGLPGCEALLAPVGSATLTNQGGTAAWSVPIPMNSFYLGVDLYFQAAVLAAGWNPAGLVLSNGGHGVIGNP